MHPSKDMLERFVIGLIDDTGDRADIRAHLEKCEFCREYCERYGTLLSSVDKQDRTGKTYAGLETKASELHQQALSGRIIQLNILEDGADHERLYLAADGKGEEKIRNLATLYSENPEVVLRIMRDTIEGYDYAQVISDDPDLAANVMIRLPEMDREFIVDDAGQARIDGLEDRDLEKLKWQLKMPQAVFAVEPLEYDPDRTEQSKEFILETDKGDRLKVTIERKTEGRQVSVQVLELNGKTDFEDARVNILCKSLSQTKGSSPEQVVSFGPIDIADKIHIRVFM